MLDRDLAEMMGLSMLRQAVRCNMERVKRSKELSRGGLYRRQAPMTDRV